MSSFNYETIFTVGGSPNRDLGVRVDGIGVYVSVEDGPEVGLSFDSFHKLADHIKTLIPARSWPEND